MVALLVAWLDFFLLRIGLDLVLPVLLTALWSILLFLPEQDDAFLSWPDDVETDPAAAAAAALLPLAARCSPRKRNWATIERDSCRSFSVLMMREVNVLALVLSTSFDSPQIDLTKLRCDSRSVSMRLIFASNWDRLLINGSTFVGCVLRERRELG